MYLCWRRWKYVADQFLNQPLRGKILWNTWRCKVASFCHTRCLFSISGVQFLLLVSWWNAFHLESPYAFYLATHCVSLECKNLCVCLFMCVSVCLRKTLVSTNTLRFCSTLRSVSLCICAVSPISTHLKLCNPVETMQHSVSATYLQYFHLFAVFSCVCAKVFTFVRAKDSLQAKFLSRRSKLPR